MRLLKIGETYLNLDNVFQAKREIANHRVEVTTPTGARVYLGREDGERLWELLGEVWAAERERPPTGVEGPAAGETPPG